MNPPPPPNSLIKCRKIQISQIILNLLNNSIHAVKDDEEKNIQIRLDQDNDF